MGGTSIFLRSRIYPEALLALISSGVSAKPVIPLDLHS